MARSFILMFKKSFFSNKMILGKQFSSSVKSIPKSSLLISGERASDTFVVVIPYLDFDDRFANLPQLENNIKRRRLDFSVSEMKESWAFYKDWNEKRLLLQENLNKVRTNIIELSKLKEKEENSTELKNMERYKSLLREDLQKVKKNVWNLEDNVICKLLKLPNILHSETPDKEEEWFTFNKENDKEGFDHLVMGVKLNCLEYENKLTYFLKNEASLFELALPELFIDHFVAKGFVRFSNPDFARNVLVEGVGLAPNESSQLFLLENTEGNNDHLHLCGGASLFPFCGLHAKHSIPKQSLPVKYISSGRHYSPNTSVLPGLYSVNQSTSVQLFVATYSEEDMYQNFRSCIENLKEIFNSFGLKFKVVNQPAYILRSWESLRVSIQVFSPNQKVFVEVGNVSMIDDYISKRLRMCYSDKNGEPFLKVVSGTIVNTQTLLALCLERSNDDLFIPSVLTKYMLR